MTVAVDSPRPRHIRSLASVARVWRWLFAVGLSWAMLVATTWAQAGLPVEEEEPKTYVPSYMIIIFAVGLGLMMICRAGKRQVTFRRD
jgi:hypothetical protein